MIIRFQQFINENKINLNDRSLVWLDEYLDEYLDENETDKDDYENERQIILNQLNDFLDADFPKGLDNLPNEVTLYRLLAVYNKDEINTEKLGRHFVAEKNLLSDPNFHEAIGLNSSFKSFYVVTVKTNSENIDIDETLKCKVAFSYEKEFTLKEHISNLNIVNVEKIHNISEEETITVYYPTTEDRASIILKSGWWSHYDPQRVCPNLECAKNTIKIFSVNPLLF
jgi:hypothetical protein